MNRMLRLVPTCGIGVLVTALTIQVGAAVAQESPFAEPVNLKVLPKDIGEEDLRRTMVGFSAALNAKCSHCHAGDANGPVRELDFPSDDKRTKRVAREMLRMVTDINERVSSLELEKGRQPVEVACMTCHRGQKRPRLIQPVLAEALQAGGAEAVIAKYSELRERYFGNHTYDLRPSTLAFFARQVASDGDVEGGIKILEFADREFPDQVRVIFDLARVHQMAGNSETAIGLLRRVVELEPDSEFYARQLAMAEGKSGE